jgi:thymidine phosphorylase
VPRVSLIIVPIVAVFGPAVPQMSGRGLGHTSGTLDKLEAIPGWRPDLNPDALVPVLREVGGVITEAGLELAPADRRLYALRASWPGSTPTRPWPWPAGARGPNSAR